MNRGRSTAQRRVLPSFLHGGTEKREGRRFLRRAPSRAQILPAGADAAVCSCSIQYIIAFTAFFLAVHLCLAAAAKGSRERDLGLLFTAKDRPACRIVVPPRVPPPDPFGRGIPLQE
jgi:hypothetical protein